MATVEAALKIVFDRHEFNLQYTSFANAHEAYKKAIAAWNGGQMGAKFALLELEDNFSRQVTIDPTRITCVNVADHSVGLQGDYSMASEQQKISLRLQREAQSPPPVTTPGPFRLQS